MDLLTKTSQQIIKFRFEYFGETLELLAAEYGVPVRLIQDTAKHESWSPQNLPLAAASSTPTDLEGLADNLLDTTRTKLTLLTLLSQQMLNPKYLEAEVTIVDKLILCAQNINVQADNAGTQMKALVGALKDMQERRHILATTGQGEDSVLADSEKVTVNIIQQFNDGKAPTITAAAA